MVQENPLQIVIVGAAIAGLMAALALRQGGHDVMVLEKSLLANEMGAAIGLQPNCTSLLRQLGIEPEDIGATVMLNMSVKNSSTLKDVEEMTKKVKEATIKPTPSKEMNIYFIHRADLHSALKEKAISLEGKGKPIQLRVGSHVQSIDESSTAIKLTDGTTLTADVILAADGVHSLCRKSLLGPKFQEKPSPVSCFRALIPMALIMNDPVTQDLVDEPGKLTEVTSLDRRVIFYPCSGGKQINILATLPRVHGGWTDDGWGNPVKREKLLSAYAEFAEPVRRMLEKATEEDITAWELFDLEPLPFWTKGSVALLGDAAHPYSPFLAQGPAQPMEDAVSLSTMLPLGTLANEAPTRLQWYEECRKDRATKIQDFSRSRGREASGQRGKAPSGQDIQSFALYMMMHNEFINSSKFLANKKADL